MAREKLYDRETDVRTARIFVIACEGEHTEKLYFEALTENLRRVRVIALPALSGLSAPEHVLERLHQFAAHHNITKDTTGGGELWMVLDVDRWFNSNRLAATHKVLDDAAQRSYQVAVSNPCFEVWLLFHFEDVPAHCSVDVQVDELMRRLRSHLNGYAKNRLEFGKFRPHIAAAMQRAKNADNPLTPRAPTAPGSHIYRLLEALQIACDTNWPYTNSVQ